MAESPLSAKAAWIEAMRAGPIAVATDTANAQHYELPPAFFQAVLGSRLKYSCCLWEPGIRSLDGAEEAMLALSAARAQLGEGQRILELGCGWGSLSLWMAARYPTAEIVSVSNSAAQRGFIEARARLRGLRNLRVLTCDVSGFDPAERFDRVVSVEMFEHMRNWEALLQRIHGWLRPQGAVFIHTFAHRERTYPYESAGPSDWMAEHFFTGGMMPSHDLLEQLTTPFQSEAKWIVNGQHYARTCRAWLRRLEARREELEPLLAETYGAGEVERWFQRWRLFFLACEELFAFRGGSEWIVSHTRLRADA